MVRARVSQSNVVWKIMGQDWTELFQIGKLTNKPYSSYMYSPWPVVECQNKNVCGTVENKLYCELMVVFEQLLIRIIVELMHVGIEKYLHFNSQNTSYLQYNSLVHVYIHQMFL